MLALRILSSDRSNRLFPGFQGASKTGNLTPKTVNSLAAIAGHEGDEEPWNIAGGYSVEDEVSFIVRTRIARPKPDTLPPLSIQLPSLLNTNKLLTPNRKIHLYLRISLCPTVLPHPLHPTYAGMFR